MENWYKKAVRFGHEFKDTDGNEYIVIEYPEREYDFLKCVKSENYERWHLLRAWRNNGVHKDTPEWESDDAERASYELAMFADDLIPIDKIRFITPYYKDRFTVISGGKILFNGKEKRVVYIDATHFYLVGKCWDSYHICQFAEICERNNITVEPVKM